MVNSEEDMEQGEGVNGEVGVVKRVEGEKVVELFNAVIDLLALRYCRRCLISSTKH